MTAGKRRAGRSWQEVQGGVSAAQGRHDQDQRTRRRLDALRATRLGDLPQHRRRGVLRTAPSCALPRAVIRGDQSAPSIRDFDRCGAGKSPCVPVFEYERSSLRSLGRTRRIRRDTGACEANLALDVPAVSAAFFRVEFAQETRRSSTATSATVGLSSPWPSALNPPHNRGPSCKRRQSSRNAGYFLFKNIREQAALRLTIPLPRGSRASSNRGKPRCVRSHSRHFCHHFLASFT